MCLRDAFPTLLALAGAALLTSGTSGPSTLSTWPQMRCDIASTGFAPKVHAALGNDEHSAVPLNILGNRSQIWSFQTGAGIFSTPIVGDQGECLVGSADRFFYAIDSKGQEIWNFLTGEIFDSAAALTADGTIWAPGGDGHLYAFNASTGTEFKRGPKGEGKASFAGHHASGSPDQHKGTHCFGAIPQGGPSTWFEGNVKISTDGTMFAGSDDFRLYSVDEHGRERFAFFPGPLPDGSVWSHAAVLEEGGLPKTVFFGALNLNFYAVSGKDGSCVWHKMLDSLVTSSPALEVTSKRLFVGSWDYNLYALDAETGEEIYRVATRDHIYASPALDVSRDRVYITSTDGCLYAIKASTGEVEWTYDTLMPIRSSPSVSSDGIIFFGNAASQLYAIKPDGTRHFSIDLTRDVTRKGINSSPALGPASVFIGSYDGNVWSVGYDHCVQNPSNRGCSVQSSGDVPTDDGDYVYWASNGGGMLEGPVWSGKKAMMGRGFEGLSVAPFGTPTLFLYVRKHGRAQEVAIEQNSVHVSLAGSEVQLTPLLTGKPMQWLILRTSGRLESEGEQVLSFSFKYSGARDKSISGSVVGQIKFRSMRSNNFIPSAERMTTFELRHMSPFIPTVLTSMNQIGFDSLYFLGKVLHINEKTGDQVALVVGAQPNASTGNLFVDPKTPSRFVVNAAQNFSALQLSGSHFRMVTGGPMINADKIQISTMLDPQGVFTNATMLVETSCTHEGLAGWGILALGLCNPQRNLVVTGSFAGKFIEYSKPAPAVASTVSWSKGGMIETTISVKVGFHTAIKASDHLAHLILVDLDKSQALDLDYVAATKVLEDADGHIVGVEITLPMFTKLPSNVRAFFLIDLNVVASSNLISDHVATGEVVVV